MRPDVVEEAVGHAVAALAAEQGGVVGVAQLRDLGLDSAAVSRRVRSGWLHPRHRGVYAVGHERLDALGTWMAAVLACGEGAVLSHRSAAAAWDLRPGGLVPVDVTVPTAGGRARRDGVRVHRAPGLPAEHATTIGRLPITTPERTLLDVAGVLTRPRDLEKAVEQAEALRLVDHAVLAGLAASRRAGAARLRAALEAPLTVTRSVLEDRFLALCRRHRLPRPLVNQRVGPFEVDFLWPAQRLVVETDGHRWHGTRRAFEDDRRRDAELTAAGLRVVRFTHRQVVDDPRGTAAVLRRLLA